ncbi:tudor domain-containing protein [Pimephales promelas]|nr:tudor domain-containing protein [Pimephales promelas]
MFTVIVKQNSSGKLSVEMYDEKTNLNLKIKEQLNKTKRNIGNGTDKAHTFKKTTKPVVQGTLEQNFQTDTNQASGHSRARPNVLHQQVILYPKLTDLPSKALDAGYVSEIYVSHCNSDLVRAEYPADGAWYRAVVQNKSDGMVQVQFIDFGNEATLLPLKIRQLGKQFLSTPRLSICCTVEDDYGNESEIDLNFVKFLPTKLLESPPQAFLCQLEALGSVDGTWSDAATDAFFELLVDEPLKVTIRNTVRFLKMNPIKKFDYNAMMVGG